MTSNIQAALNALEGDRMDTLRAYHDDIVRTATVAVMMGKYIEERRGYYRLLLRSDLHSDAIAFDVYALNKSFDEKRGAYQIKWIVMAFALKPEIAAKVFADPATFVRSDDRIELCNANFVQCGEDVLPAPIELHNFIVPGKWLDQVNDLYARLHKDKQERADEISSARLAVLQKMLHPNTDWVPQ